MKTDTIAKPLHHIYQTMKAPSLPWVFGSIITIAVIIFMIATCATLWLVLGPKPEARVHIALVAMTASCIISCAILVLNTVMQARVIRTLYRHIYGPKTDVGQQRAKYHSPHDPSGLAVAMVAMSFASIGIIGCSAPQWPTQCKISPSSLKAGHNVIGCSCPTKLNWRMLEDPGHRPRPAGVVIPVCDGAELPIEITSANIVLPVVRP